MVTARSRIHLSWHGFLVMILHKLKQWANPVTTQLPNGDRDCSFFDCSFSALRLEIFSLILLRSPLWHSVDGENESHRLVKFGIYIPRFSAALSLNDDCYPALFNSIGIAKVKTIESGTRHSFSGFGGAFPQHCAKCEAGMAGHGVAGGELILLFDRFHFEVYFFQRMICWVVHFKFNVQHCFEQWIFLNIPNFRISKPTWN